MQQISPIGPLVPFACSYRSADERLMGITMWGTDEAIILANNRHELRRLQVDGILLATCSATKPAHSATQTQPQKERNPPCKSNRP